MARWWPRSLAGQVFALQVLVLAGVVAAGSVLALLNVRRDVNSAARDQVVGIATALADSPSTAEAIESGRATEVLQPVTEAVRRNADIAFITIMAPDGTRFTHPNPSRIGGEYLGTTAPALRGETFTEVYTGTLGTSIRAVAPVRDRSGHIVGLVSAGITTQTLAQRWRAQWPPILAISAVALLMSFVGVWGIERRLMRQTRGLRPDELRRSGDEQAALRRVATLVAEGASPADTFSAVAAEVGKLFGAEIAVILRYEQDREVTVVGGWSIPGISVPVGSRFTLAGTGVAVKVLETRRPARTEQFDGPQGSIAALFRGFGGQSGVGTPITVEGLLWGVLVIVSTSTEGLSAGSDVSTARFTDLLATALANAQGRETLRRVGDEHAALRRVATLVAAGAPPPEVFTCVAKEVGRLLVVDRAYVARYEGNDAITVASWSATGETLPVGALGWAREGSAGALVRRTGEPARVDRGADSATHEAGVRTAVAAPVRVKSLLWGLVIVASTGEAQPPPDTEARLGDFTELLAIAIANADAQAELMASRARIVGAADQARRRIERNLHDSAQQRLVTLILKLHDAQTLVPPKSAELSADLNRAVADAQGALDELREIARGIHPAVLTEGGLGPALRALARRCPLPVELEVGSVARAPESVEVAAYYVVAEALTNAVKHARTPKVRVEVGPQQECFSVRVSDDGIGGAEPGGGSGLLGLKDRVGALGGTLVLRSPPGAGTEVYVELPLHPAPS